MAGQNKTKGERTMKNEKTKIRINWGVFFERVVAPVICVLMVAGIWWMIVDLFARGW